MSGGVAAFIASSLLVKVVTSTQIQHTSYSRRSDLADLIFTQDVVSEAMVRSGMECLSVCAAQKSCVSATYNGNGTTPGQCRGYRTMALSVGSGTVSVGAQTYVWNWLNSGDSPTNLALGMPTEQSSILYNNHPAERGVDGDSDNNFDTGDSCTMTRTDNVPWWQVDLGQVRPIVSVLIVNRGDCCGSRLSDFKIDVYSDVPGSVNAVATTCHNYNGPMATGATELLQCQSAPLLGRVVRITNTANMWLTLCEVEVMGYL